MDSKPTLLNVSAYDSDSSIETILVQFEPYIVRLAQEVFGRYSTYSELQHPEIDDIVQEALIKFWQALQEREITHPRAYLRRVVYHEFVNVCRRNRVTLLPLPLDSEGEIRHGQVIAGRSEELDDPECVFEQRSAQADLMEHLADAVVTELPPRQKRAMICSLRDRVDDVLMLVAAFQEHREDIAQAEWPQQREAVQRLKASLSPARQKIADYMQAHGISITP
ncbi:MAG: sigma-70 family RNA polymerase sigma factor [Chloroflexota bacterium]|nr:sigma-70 family RNA polymerase sigma factor [Chloroflexota bacterium]